MRPQNTLEYQAWELGIEALDESSLYLLGQIAGPEFTFVLNGSEAMDAGAMMAWSEDMRAGCGNWLGNYEIAAADLVPQKPRTVAVTCSMSVVHCGVLRLPTGEEYPPPSTHRTVTFDMVHTVTVDEEGKVTRWEIEFNPTVFRT